MASDSSNSISVSPCSPPPARGNAGDQPVCGLRASWLRLGRELQRRELDGGAVRRLDRYLRPRTTVKAPFAGAGRARLAAARVAGGTKFA